MALPMLRANHEMTVLALATNLLSLSLGVRVAIKLAKVTVAVRILRITSLLVSRNEMKSVIRKRGSGMAEKDNTQALFGQF